MERHKPSEQQTRLLIDEIYEYRGFYDDGGRCRLRIYDRPTDSPVLLFSELPDNTNTSVTNMIEVLVAEAGTKLLPHRFDYEDPFRVIEHYQGNPEGRTEELKKDRYSLVEFADYKLRRQWLGGVERVAIGQPAWKHIERHDVEQMIGALLT